MNDEQLIVLYAERVSFTAYRLRANPTTSNSAPQSDAPSMGVLTLARYHLNRNTHLPFIRTDGADRHPEITRAGERDYPRFFHADTGQILLA